MEVIGCNLGTKRGKVIFDKKKGLTRRSSCAERIVLQVWESEEAVGAKSSMATNGGNKKGW